MALWEEKLALRPGFAGNEATDWGTRQEASALTRYEQLTGHLVSACRFSVLRDDAVHGWLGASPDGLIDSLAVTPGQCLPPFLCSTLSSTEHAKVELSAWHQWTLLVGHFCCSAIRQVLVVLQEISNNHGIPEHPKASRLAFQGSLQFYSSTQQVCSQKNCFHSYSSIQQVRPQTKSFNCAVFSQVWFVFACRGGSAGIDGGERSRGLGD